MRLECYFQWLAVRGLSPIIFEDMCSVRKPSQCSTPGLSVAAPPVSFCSATRRAFEGGNLTASESRACRDFALVTSRSRIFAHYLRPPVDVHPCGRRTDRTGPLGGTNATVGPQREYSSISSDVFSTAGQPVGQLLRFRHFPHNPTDTLCKMESNSAHLVDGEHSRDRCCSTTATPRIPFRF